MGILVLTDAVITLGGTAITDHSNKVEIPIEADELDITVFGGVWKQRTGGLLDGKVNISLFQDFADNNIDELFWGWVIARANIAFAIKPTSGAISASNPEYTGLVMPKNTAPLNNGVGDVAKFDISWPTSGAVTRDITP